MEDEKKPDEKSTVSMIGHILIRDKDTQAVLVNQRDNLVHQPILGNDNAR